MELFFEFILIFQLSTYLLHIYNNPIRTKFLDYNRNSSKQTPHTHTYTYTFILLSRLNQKNTIPIEMLTLKLIYCIAFNLFTLSLCFPLAEPIHQFVGMYAMITIRQWSDNFHCNPDYRLNWYTFILICIIDFLVK